MQKKRKLDNWLRALDKYVEDTEAPRAYWRWAGIFTLCAALQRKVWVPYGLENIYPNLYLLIIAGPGERKAAPPSLAKKLLTDAQVPVAVDSSSKRALTEELAATTQTETFHWKGKPRMMASLAVISKEMSSLLAVDPKGIIEVLTDLYDSHDEWKYKTSGKGEDLLYNVCVSCFVVTTPTWFSGNLPEEAIGGGYTSRHIIVSGGQRYKTVPWPSPPDKQLYQALLHDLIIVRDLVGEFVIVPEAKDLFSAWYEKIPDRSSDMIKNVRPFLNRMHVIALKVAMAIRVSYSDELIITPTDMQIAIALVETAIPMATLALGGQGKSKFGPDTERIKTQIANYKKVSKRELLSLNYSELTLSEFNEVLDGIVAMGWCRIIQDGQTGEEIIHFIKPR